LHNILSHLIPNNLILYFLITALYVCRKVAECPENFCVPPLITKCVNYTCICDDPPYGEPIYDYKDDFVAVRMEKPKIKNKEMMMRERELA